MKGALLSVGFWAVFVSASTCICLLLILAGVPLPGVWP